MADKKEEAGKAKEAAKKAAKEAERAEKETEGLALFGKLYDPELSELEQLKVVAHRARDLSPVRGQFVLQGAMLLALTRIIELLDGKNEK